MGRLFEEIKKVSASQGTPLSKLENEMDIGYVEEPVNIRRVLNEKGVLSEGEVLEYAYRFKDYYPYLHKHGFPLPFSMDDFDPDTKEDAEVREEIYQEVEKIKRTVTQDRGLNPGSDAYDLALAEAIYKWCLKKTEGFSTEEEDVRERTALEAYLERKGECTERSAIVFYVLKVAGLDPGFFEGNPNKPTLQNYPWERRDAVFRSHIFVSIFLGSSNRRVDIDVTQKKFDSVYPKVVALTPRQFVSIAYLNNRMNNARSGGTNREMENSIEACRRVAPLSYHCFREAWYTHLLEDTSLKKARAFLERYQSVLTLYPELSPLVSLELKKLEAELNKDFREINLLYAEEMDLVEKLSRQLPGIAAPLYAKKAVFILKQLKFGKTRNPKYADLDQYSSLLKKSVEFTKKAICLNPNNMDYIHLLTLLYDENPSPFFAKDLGIFFDSIAKSNPNNTVARYFAANYTLQRSNQYKLTPAEIALVKEQVDKLMLLEPEHPFVKELYINYLLSAEKFKTLIAYLESRISSDEELNPQIFSFLAMAYFATGRCSKCYDTFRDGIKLYPKEIEKELLYLWKHRIFLKPIPSLGADRIALERRNGLFHCLTNIISLLTDSDFLDEKPFLYAKLFWVGVVLNIQSEEFKQIKDQTGKSVLSEVESSLLEELGGFLAMLHVSGSKGEKCDIHEVEKIISAVSPFLKNAGKEVLSGMYAELTLQALLQDNQGKAKTFYDSAMMVDGDFLKGLQYKERVLESLFDSVMNDHPKEENLDRAWQSLEIIYPDNGKFSHGLKEIVIAAYKQLEKGYIKLSKQERVALIQQRLSGL